MCVYHRRKKQGSSGMLPRSFSAVLPAARKKDAAAARAALSNKKGCVIMCKKTWIKRG